ncbi:pyridoxal phosphate-dependent aminotransferase family protein [Croceitalea sp. MTPC9]|uniref:aminotransferase class I/II-fold pyridoxal phosphate-dependent enzyme n=1 Tax=unclassified Croceitalea TaxID=2632280 RepID=UPI002B3E8F8A|nr:pyridoxal phosphate-dependent aminotransferase family protein [Croceitalea sp. MTPC6]GMN16862.1 pyridoxal phosphate-dependent aminotransferase family protein [Croceitalea sp. MTPC9]
MPDFPKKLIEKLKKRVAENSFRTLPLGNNLIDFSSNDYLGFSKETWIGERAQEILKSSAPKNGATGSRLLSGNHKLYQVLENQLSNFHNVEAALVFNSGYDANLGLFACVPQRGDFIFYDELCHASIRDGIQLSNAKKYKFKHNDLDDLNAKIKLLFQKESGIQDKEIYIVTESVFSMDGDSPDLRFLARLCKENNYHLVVDEAHAIGVFGKGLVSENNLQNEVFAKIITFGKALGCHGAAILGSGKLKEFLINFARSFIYTTALPPHAIASILAAYDFINSPEGKRSRQLLLENIVYFKQELKKQGLEDNFIESDSAIQSMEIEGNIRVKNISEKLIKEGFDVKAILSPTVPEGKERLRFCLHSFNTKEEITNVVQILKGDV